MTLGNLGAILFFAMWLSLSWCCPLEVDFNLLLPVLRNLTKLLLSLSCAFVRTVPTNNYVKKFDISSGILHHFLGIQNCGTCGIFICLSIDVQISLNIFSLKYHWIFIFTCFIFIYINEANVVFSLFIFKSNVWR